MINKKKSLLFILISFITIITVKRKNKMWNKQKNKENLFFWVLIIIMIASGIYLLTHPNFEKKLNNNFLRDLNNEISNYHIDKGILPWYSEYVDIYDNYKTKYTKDECHKIVNAEDLYSCLIAEDYISKDKLSSKFKKPKSFDNKLIYKVSRYWKRYYICAEKYCYTNMLDSIWTRAIDWWINVRLYNTNENQKLLNNRLNNY